MRESLDVMEKAIIGALMNPRFHSKDEIDLQGSDFNDIRCEAVYEHMQRMDAQGKPLDPATVDRDIRETPGFDVRGVNFIFLMECNDANYNFGLIPSYVEAVKAAAVKRDIRAAAVSIMQAVDEDMKTDDLVDFARRAVDQSGNVSDVQLQSVADSIGGTVEALRNPVKGSLSPWADLNILTGGLSPGRLYVVGARPSVGKALALDTPLPTPGGWTTMGAVKVGDYLIGNDGKPTRVVAATDVMHDRPCYAVKFDDGTEIVADEQHEWFTNTRASRRAEAQLRYGTYRRESKYSRDQRDQNAKPGIVTTREIFETQRTGCDNRANHAVDNTAPVELPDADLVIDPYVLGVWLGDGASNGAQITSADDEIVQAVIDAGYSCRKLKSKYQYTLSDGRGTGGRFLNELRQLNLVQNKHIPAEYLRASYQQRLALMRGLMDTDGTVSCKSGRCSFDVTSRTLAEGFRELAHTLGLRTSWGEKRVNGRTEESSICYRVGFTTNLAVARLTRKADLLPTEVSPKASKRMILSVEKVESVPVRCVQVDNHSHMYLASEAMVPTHNSVIALQLAMGLSRMGYVSFNSLEMGTDEINTRIMAHDLKIDMSAIQDNQLTPEQQARVDEFRDSRPRHSLIINDDSNATFASIRRHARSVARKGKLAGIVVDYLQLMSADRGDRRNRHEVVAEWSRALKNLAREMNAPVIALSQLNRDSVNGEDKMPKISHLRESGAVEQDADVVLLLHREIIGPEQGELKMLVAKNRQGRTGVVDLDFYGHYSEARSTR